jgi:Flp pilus assembly protein TadG
MKKKLMFSDQGQTLVETALSLGLLLTMILGVIEGALMLTTYHYLSYAARQGSRYAMVRGSQCTGFANACPAVASDVTTYVRGIPFVGVDPTKLTVNTTWGPAPATGSSCATPACDDPGDQVTVTVTYPLSGFTVPLISAFSGNMHSSSTMVIAQ